MPTPDGPYLTPSWMTPVSLSVLLRKIGTVPTLLGCYEAYTKAWT